MRLFKAIPGIPLLKVRQARLLKRGPLPKVATTLASGGAFGPPCDETGLMVTAAPERSGTKKAAPDPETRRDSWGQEGGCRS